MKHKRFIAAAVVCLTMMAFLLSGFAFASSDPANNTISKTASIIADKDEPGTIPKGPAPICGCSCRLIYAGTYNGDIIYQVYINYVANYAINALSYTDFKLMNGAGTQVYIDFGSGYHSGFNSTTGNVYVGNVYLSSSITSVKAVSTGLVVHFVATGNLAITNINGYASFN